MTTPGRVDRVDESTLPYICRPFTYTDFIIIYEGTTPPTCGQLLTAGWTGPPCPPTKPVLNGHDPKLGQTRPLLGGLKTRGGDPIRDLSRSRRPALKVSAGLHSPFPTSALVGAR